MDNEATEEPFDLDAMIAQLTPEQREHLREYGLNHEPFDRERVIGTGYKIYESP